MRKRKGLWQVEETVHLYKNGWLEVCEDKVIRTNHFLNSEKAEISR